MSFDSLYLLCKQSSLIRLGYLWSHVLELVFLSCSGVEQTYLTQPQTERWPMALFVWTAFKMSACKGNSTEISSSFWLTDRSLLFLPSFWQGGGMELGAVAMDVIFAVVYYFVEGKVSIHWSRDITEKENTAGVKVKHRKNVNAKNTPTPKFLASDNLQVLTLVFSTGS